MTRLEHESRSAPALAKVTEQCPACLQLYVYELEVRCARCDEPACPFCAIEARVWICHSCVEEEDDVRARDVEG